MYFIHSMFSVHSLFFIFMVARLASVAARSKKRRLTCALSSAAIHGRQLVKWATRPSTVAMSDIYQIDSDIKFRMLLFRPGIRFPFYGSSIEIFSSLQRYRAFVSESLPSENVEAGVAYDYYNGVSLNFDWKLDVIKPRLDGGINPSNCLLYTSDAADE